MRYYDPLALFDQILLEVDRKHARHTAFDEVRVYSDGKFEKYLKNGALHREDGPALIEYDDKGAVVKSVYYLDGEKVSKEVVDQYRIRKEDERIHTLNIAGKTYQVNGKKLRELEKFLS